MQFEIPGDNTPTQRTEVYKEKIDNTPDTPLITVTKVFEIEPLTSNVATSMVKSNKISDANIGAITVAENYANIGGNNFFLENIQKIFNTKKDLAFDNLAEERLIQVTQNFIKVAGEPYLDFSTYSYKDNVVTSDNLSRLEIGRASCRERV